MSKADEPPSEMLRVAKRWLRYHAPAYLVGNALLIGLNVALAGRWWSLWLLFFWSIALAYHFFLVRGHSPDDDWVWARFMREDYQDNKNSDLTERYDREPHRNILPADLARRRPVWFALSELWLDTELQNPDLKWIASRLVATGYAWTEIERICLHEVTPALFDCLRAPDGFDPEWLEDRILNLIGRPDHDAWVAQNQDKLWQFIGQDWHAVARLFQELQVSGH